MTDDKVTCDRCGYEWTYSGTMDMTTCPNCQRKTDTTTETND